MDAVSPWFAPSVTVAVSNVHVHYRVPSSEMPKLGSLSVPAYKLRRVVGAQPKVLVRALAGVSLVARRGESVGIIGTNGSGKSTLLRMVAGLEVPTVGDVVARSTPVLLGVNAALVPQMSGEQNVRLGCLALGLTPDETDAALPGVIELAGIGKSIYLPMRSYSSGMGARLRFAIAAAARPDILLIDEALSTGDAAFKERSKDRMDQMLADAGTVFLVSHAAQTIEEMCTRAIWLHRGRLVLDGPAEETARRYRWWAWNVAKGEHEVARRLLDEALADGDGTKVTLYQPTLSHTGPRHVRAAK